jgi:hypothetical protein
VSCPGRRASWPSRGGSAGAATDAAAVMVLDEAVAVDGVACMAITRMRFHLRDDVQQLC